MAVPIQGSATTNVTIASVTAAGYSSTYPAYAESAVIKVYGLVSMVSYNVYCYVKTDEGFQNGLSAMVATKTKTTSYDELVDYSA